MKKIMLFKLLFIQSFLSLAHDDAGSLLVNDELKFVQERTLEKAKSLRALFNEEVKVVNEFNSSKRTQWTNLPVGIIEREGVSIGQMNDKQRIALHELLSVALSSQGYLKVTGIMHLDNILVEHFNIPSLKWSHENYYFSFWNEPNKSNEWGFKLEGHHLSLNFTYKDMSFSATPMFLGADPAEIRETEYAGWKLFNQEEGLSFRLMNSLNEKQKEKAILDRKVPRDILTNPDSSQRLTEYWGIKASELSSKQKNLLIKLIKEHIGNLEDEYASFQWKKIESAGIENIYFSWIGKTQKSDSNYYLIHGPNLIIEYDNHRNHIHTIFRDKDNDFGSDVLKDHLEKKH